MEKINKTPIFEWFYDHGDIYVTVLIKGGNEALSLPPHFYSKDTETFILGSSPTPNLSYDNEGITAPMRFSGNLFNCFFPWESVIMITGNVAVIQFAHANQDIQKNGSVKEKDINKEEKGKIKKNHLSVVK